MGDGWDHIWSAVQAVGSIAGIFAAVWVGYAAIRAENKRTEARGRVTAFRLSPYMVSIVAEVDRGLKSLVELRKNESRRGMVTRSTMELAWSLRVAHAVPADVFSESWTLPPHIALAVAQLDNILGLHAGLLDNAESALISMSAEQKADYYHRIETSLNAVGRLGREVKKYCAGVGDAVVQEMRHR